MKKIIIILGVLGAAFSAIFVRFSTAPSTVLVFYRLFISAILLTPVVINSHRNEFKELNRNKILMCMLSGLFLGLHFTCYFESLKFTSISSAVVLVDTEVFFVAFGGLLFLKEGNNLKGWLSIIITFIGSMIVSLGDKGAGMLKGDIIALLGAFFVAIYTLIGRKMRAGMSTTLYTYIVYLSACLVSLLTNLIGKNSILPISGRNFLAALGLAVFCTLLGHSIFSWGLKYEKASFISTVKLLEPVFASILGMFIFDEIPTLNSLIGGIAIITGICIATLGNQTS